MKSRWWTDDDLLAELGAALREEQVEEGIVRAGLAAFAWRTVDADLEIIGPDAASALAGTGQVRSGQPGSPRTLFFHGERVSVDMEIDDAGLMGQLTPSGPGQVTLITADGPQATVLTDEVGGFTLPPPGCGPIRLECTLGADHFLTEWTTPVTAGGKHPQPGAATAFLPDLDPGRISSRVSWRPYQVTGEAGFGVDQQRCANVRGLITPSASMPFALWKARSARSVETSNVPLCGIPSRSCTQRTRSPAAPLTVVLNLFMSTVLENPGSPRTFPWYW